MISIRNPHADVSVQINRSPSLATFLEIYFQGKDRIDNIHGLVSHFWSQNISDLARFKQYGFLEVAELPDCIGGP